MSIQQNFPGFSPSLNLNFARSKRLDQRVTFVRQTGATVTNELGLLERVGNNIPRFEHKYDASTRTVRSLGLLIEEQRENLVDYSNDFTQLWSQPDIITANDTISPDGTLNAAKVTNDSNSNNYNFAGYRVFAETKTTYTYSFFIKDDDSGAFSIIVGTQGFNSGTGTYARNTFNFSTKTFTTFQYVGQESGYVTNQRYEEYPNGWFRIITTFNTSSFTSTQTEINFGFYQGVYGSTSSYYQKSLYTWGHQLEVGAFPTSYIPTTGLPTTRAEDSVYIDGRIGDNFSWYNPLEGSILWTGNVYGTEKPAVCPYKISNLSNLRGIGVQFDTRSLNNNAVFMARAVSSNIPVENAPFGTIPSSDTIKISGAYEEGVGISAAFDGSPPASSGGGSQTDIVFGDEYYLDIGGSRSLSGTNNKFTGVCEQLIYYPRRITDLQLQSISK